MASQLEVLLGPFLLLGCIAILLFGVFIAQVYAYWFSFKDRQVLRVLVLAMLILETIHTALCLHVLYEYFAVELGLPDEGANFIWSFQVSTYLKITVITIAQGFSIYRIWQLSGKQHLPTIIPAVILVGSSGLGLAATILAGKSYSWAEFNAQRYSRIVLNCCLALYVLLDTILATLLTFYLHRHRSEFNFRRTQHLLQRVAIYGVGTGAVTATGEVVTLLTFNLCKSSLVYPGMLLVIGKVYANAMLVMLNMRHHMKGDLGKDGVISIPLGFRDTSPTYDRETRGSRGPTCIEVSKEVTRTVSTSVMPVQSRRSSDFVLKDDTSLA